MSALQSEQQLAEIAAILPAIKNDASQAERQGHLTEKVLNAFIEHGVFKLFVSTDYNGKPTDLPTAMKIFELIASADGASGWLAMIGAGGGLFSGFMQPESASRIFSPDNALIAGSGMPSGIASATDKGFEVSGRWTYASGAHYATWFTANYRIDDGNEQIVSLAVPAEKVTIHDTWHVIGMKATGSHDFSIEPTFVDAEFGFNLFAEPVLDDAIYKCPLMTLASLSFASVAIGIAQHGLEAFTEFSETKVIADQQTLAVDRTIQQRVAHASGLISLARENLYQMADKAWQQLQTGKNLDDTLQKQIDINCIDIVGNCVKAVDELKMRAGMMAIFNDSEFGRAWRDIHVLSQHIIVACKN